MYPAGFEYHVPASLGEAIELLGRLKDDAKVLAGGHSLIPMMRLRLSQPKHLIDLRKVPGLRGITEDRTTLKLGAMTAHWDVESSALVKSKLPVLSELAGMIADPQVRNRGTIGGSLSHADPAADYPAAMIALGAVLVCEGANGRRAVAADDWFEGVMTTALLSDELLVEVRVPIPCDGSGAAYVKLPHPATRFAVVGVAAVVTLDEQGTCTKARIGITGIGARAVRALAVEAALQGSRLDAGVIKAAAQKGAEGIDVQGDLQNSAEYKAHLCRAVAERAISEAAKRATGTSAG